MVNYERRRKSRLKEEGERVLRPEAKWIFFRFNKLFILKLSGILTHCLWVARDGRRQTVNQSSSTAAPGTTHNSQIFLHLKLFNQLAQSEILFEYYWKGERHNEELKEKIRFRFHCNDIYVFSTRDISSTIKTSMFVVSPRLNSLDMCLKLAYWDKELNSNGYCMLNELIEWNWLRLETRGFDCASLYLTRSSSTVAKHFYSNAMRSDMRNAHQMITHGVIVPPEVIIS